MARSEKAHGLSDFLEFIEKDMRMSHIYQPLLIRMLLESGGASTLRDLALRFVTFNEAELQAMEKTLKKMPVQVLKNRGWVERDGDTVRLTVKPADLKERSMLIGACERRLHEFIESRGEKIWDYRWLDDPVSGSLRFEILAASGQKCALCGISAKDRPLDVDHIVPRSRGGKSSADNLQVLCSKCNRSKGNRDDLGTINREELMKTDKPEVLEIESFSDDHLVEVLYSLENCLSQRSYNVLIGLINQKGARYVCEFFDEIDFQTLRNCGSKSAKELKETGVTVRERLIENKGKSEEEIINEEQEHVQLLDDHSKKQSEVIALSIFNAGMEALSVRARNAMLGWCLRNGGKGEFLRQIGRHSFEEWRGVGKKTVIELQEFESRLVGLWHELPLRREALSIHEMGLLSELFSEKFNSLTVRSRNAMQQWMRSNGGKTEFLRDLRSHNFLDWRNVGGKSAKELNQLREILLDFVESRSEKRSLSVVNGVSDSDAETWVHWIEDLKPFGISNALECGVELDGILSENYCDFIKLLNVMARHGLDLGKRWEILLRPNVSDVELAKEMKLSRERIRQIRKRQGLSRVLKREMFSCRLQARLIEKSIITEILSVRGYVIILPCLNEHDNATNSEFLRATDNILVESQLIQILSPHIEAVDQKCLVTWTNTVDDKEFLKSAVVLCDKRSVSAKSIRTAMHVLAEEFGVKRRRDLTLAWDRISPDLNQKERDLLLILSSLESDDYGLVLPQNRKYRKADELVDFLRKSKTPMSRTMMMAHFNWDKKDVEGAIRHEEIVFYGGWYRSGESAYGLEEWRTEKGYIPGTLRSVVIEYLERQESVAHIQEIFDFVSEHRSTTLQSLVSNIKLTTDILDHGNGYFSSKSKKISDWEFNASAIQRWHYAFAYRLIKERTFLTKKDFINEVIKESGLEERQIEIIIKAAERKGLLRETGGHLVYANLNKDELFAEVFQEQARNYKGYHPYRIEFNEFALIVVVRERGRNVQPLDFIVNTIIEFYDAYNASFVMVMERGAGPKLLRCSLLPLDGNNEAVKELLIQPQNSGALGAFIAELAANDVRSWVRQRMIELIGPQDEQPKSINEMRRKGMTTKNVSKMDLIAAYIALEEHEGRNVSFSEAYQTLLKFGIIEGSSRS